MSAAPPHKRSVPAPGFSGALYASSFVIHPSTPSTDEALALCQEYARKHCTYHIKASAGSTSSAALSRPVLSDGSMPHKLAVLSWRNRSAQAVVHAHAHVGVAAVSGIHTRYYLEGFFESRPRSRNVNGAGIDFASTKHASTRSTASKQTVATATEGQPKTLVGTDVLR